MKIFAEVLIKHMNLLGQSGKVEHLIVSWSVPSQTLPLCLGAGWSQARVRLRVPLDPQVTEHSV